MNKYTTLILLLAFFILTRLFVLYYFIDDVFTCEELHQGTVAKEIMEGADLPLMEYPPNAYNGGTLVVGLVNIPFFAILGKNLFAMKLTPLLFSTLTLALFFLFAQRYFGNRVAFISGILYTCSSFIWVTFNLYHAGFHSENLFFTFLAALIFYRIVFEEKRNWFLYLSLGLVCGFGVYFSYTFLVTLAAFFIVWLLRKNRSGGLKGCGYFFAGMLIGLLPWFWYNLESQMKGVFDIFPNLVFWQKDAEARSLWALLKGFLRIAGFFGLVGVSGLGRVVTYVTGFVYCAFYWGGVIFIFRRYRFSLKALITSKESFVLIFPFMLIVVATLYGVEAGGGYFLDWKYVVGLYPFVFLTVALFLERILARSGKLKSIVIVLFTIVIAVSGFQYVRKATPSNFGKGFGELGYSYQFLSESFNSKYPRNLYKILDDITRLSAPEKYEVLTQSLTIQLSGNDSVEPFSSYVSLAVRLNEKYKPHYFKILVKGVYFVSDESLEMLVKKLSVLKHEVPQAYWGNLYEGLGAIMVKRFSEHTQEYEVAARFIPEEYRVYYYRGLSEPLYLDFIGDYVERAAKVLAWIPKEYRARYLDGLGDVLGKMGVSYIMERLPADEEDVKIFYRFIRALADSDKRLLLEGMGRGIALYYTRNTYRDIHDYLNNFTQADKEVILNSLERK